MIRALALLLFLALPAAAQEAPSVGVALDPEGPVTVGNPVRVSLTVLVPSYMPEPPEWPDLEIADAITRLPERATTPVTRRIGGAAWSGLTRTYEIVPQRAADYDLSDAVVTLTWSGDDGTPQTESFPVPEITFSASVPAGAEGLDPFLAASALTVAASTEGLPAAPKPGDAVTLTVTATASGPPAMLLPPLSDRIPTPEGLRAYPREPALTDIPGERGAPPTATRVESITYVIEQPGSYTLPAVSLDWWNIDTQAVATVTTEPVAFEVAAPGWKAAADGAADGPLRVFLSAAALLLLAAVAALRHRRRARRTTRPPSERHVYRALRRSVRHGPAGALRRRVLDWSARAAPGAPGLTADIEAALVDVERSAYGNTPAAPAARDPLLAALARRRAVLLRKPGDSAGRLPPLNPVPQAS